MAEYTAEGITVLEGLEAVRRRPGMYIGDTRDGSRLHHMLWEVVGNAVDEHLGGTASQLSVRYNGNCITVTDNGRGLPMEPLRGRPAAELIFSTLHASGTLFGHFPHVHIAPGLHGVGCAVVTALSDWLSVEVRRGGRRYEMDFVRGELATPLHDTGACDATGTRVRFRPDPSIFGQTEFSDEPIRHQLQQLAYLNPELSISWNEQPLLGGDGLGSLCRSLCEVPDCAEPLGLRGRHQKVEVDVALIWDGGGPPRLASFVSQYAADSGSHIAGFWRGLRAALVEFEPSLRGLPLERLGAGLCAALHVRLYDPCWGDPTKSRLDSPEAQRAVYRVMSGLAVFLRERPCLRRRLLARCSGQSK